MAGVVSSDSKFGPAKWIVSPNISDGATHTTIASALTSASSGDTILIRDGSYTENLTGKAGVSITAARGSDSEPTVTIIGNCTFTAAGTFSISNIRLQTNSAALLTVSGSAASIVNLNGCYLNCTNNTGITFSTSSSSGKINIFNCRGDVGTTGIALFAHSSAGEMIIFSSFFTNSGSSTTASTASAGTLTIRTSFLMNPITTSGTAAFTFTNSNIPLDGLNTTAFTLGGSGQHTLQTSTIGAGTASAISIGNTTDVNNCVVDSTNTNAITGAGTIRYAEVAFSNTSSVINTSTKTARNIGAGGISFDGGTNTLSTYTEGTFTPTLVGQTSAGTTTYAAQNGYYIRVGNMVQAQGQINTTAATGTGNVLIGGLPFTIRNQTNGTVRGTISISNTTVFTFPASTSQAIFTGILNTTTANISCQGANIGASNLQMASGTCNFSFNVIYEI